jgi:two-component system cell cycle response regulator DivK
MKEADCMSVEEPPLDSEALTPLPVCRPARRVGKWVSFAEARQRLRGLDAVVLDADVEAGGRIFVSLGQAGAKVRLARGLVAGCKLIDEVKPHIVLIATRLLDGDAFALAQRLKAGSGKVPLVVALGTPDGRGDRKRFMEAGCDAFLRKPVDVQLFALELARQLPAGPQLPTVATR